jgi:hypothetical protein
MEWSMPSAHTVSAWIQHCETDTSSIATAAATGAALAALSDDEDEARSGKAAAGWSVEDRKAKTMLPPR